MPNHENYTTISLPSSVKEVLQSAKGDKEWGEYLLSLFEECSRLRKDNAFKNLKMLLEPELDKIENSSREFRETFNLRNNPPETSNSVRHNYID